MTIEEALRGLKAGRFGFIDAGTSKGAAIPYCEKRFERGVGIGFDIRDSKVKEAEAAGFNVCKCDLRTQKFPANCVSFACMLDLLEHLRSMDMAEEIVMNLAVPARDFLFIRHPNFNDIEYLRSLGLKLTWTDWEGHRNMAHTDRFRELCERHGWGYSMIPARQILDSRSQYVVPLKAPQDTTQYSERDHGPKPCVTFDRFVSSFTDIFIKLNDAIPQSEWFDILRRGSYHQIDLSGHHIDHIMNHHATRSAG